jgi:hypothetical protein
MHQNEHKVKPQEISSNIGLAHYIFDRLDAGQLMITIIMPHDAIRTWTNLSCSRWTCAAPLCGRMTGQYSDGVLTPHSAQAAQKIAIGHQWH